ncbi:hypothetical protein [Streptomyces ficellus]|uniref:Serine/threonine protein kinase n=1 Tax=Streptomyces ficellus TaxID=1977088 RepID=A0A6I6FHV9_9ACTN|nr:hypothetical protein [Streptomyces ficellus]QGV79692.1 hypothetical protein EIZ62_16670 [Streptomyces ficellus]
MNLRVTGLGAVVVLTALLPLAASAGPAGDPEAPAGPATDAAPGTGPGAGPGTAAALLAGIDSPASAPSAPPAPTRPPARPSRASCGPEVASPDGVEAQTCVLTEDRDTWARTYYRNATGGELVAVLTLMGPGGRTVQAHCDVRAEDEPGVCETPREPSRGTSAEYTAVAEFAESGESALLLRSGSNSPDPAAS